MVYNLEYIGGTGEDSFNDNPICKTEKETQMYRTDFWTLWEKARDVLREQHWNKYTIKGETDCQSRLDVWDKCSGLVHWEDPEGGEGEGGGRGDRDVEYMWIYGWFMSMYGKNHYNIVK